MVSIVASHAYAQDSGPVPADGVYDMLVGTYTGGKSEGIYVYRFDTKTGDGHARVGRADGQPVVSSW